MALNPNSPPLFPSIFAITVVGLFNSHKKFRVEPAKTSSKMAGSIPTDEGGVVEEGV